MMDHDRVIACAILCLTLARPEMTHQIDDKSSNSLNDGNVDSSLFASSSSETYMWLYSDWSSCAGTCGMAVQSRNASCVTAGDNSSDVLATRVKDILCDSSLVSELERPCDDSSLCHDNWTVSEWSTCFLWSGIVRIREVVCQVSEDGTDESVASPTSEHLCSLESRPELIQPCTDSQMAWLTGPWSKCNSTCGTGHRSRDVWCADVHHSASGNLVTLPDSFCSSSVKPFSIQRCYSGSCSGADWVVSAWSGCKNDSCDQTYETRLVMCVGKDGKQHLDFVCDASRQPAAKRICNQGVDCENGTGAAWFSFAWGPCSVTCGFGKQFRRVFCGARKTNESVVVLPDDNCINQTQMSVERDCVLHDCQGVWITSSFGKCSVSCGRGSRKRRVWCLFEGNFTEDSFCDIDRPDESENCSAAPCPESLRDAPNCLELEFGCCEDGTTPADGPNQAGCPLPGNYTSGSDSCQDNEFGCCPDQITPAEGPFAEGCPTNDCEVSEFGCCPDGLTTALDEEGANCDLERNCESSDLGCCPENATDDLDRCQTLKPNSTSVSSYNDSATMEMSLEQNETAASGDLGPDDFATSELTTTDDFDVNHTDTDSFSDGATSLSSITTIDVYQDYVSTPVQLGSTAPANGCSPSPDGITEASDDGGCLTASPSTRQIPELCSLPMERGYCWEKHRMWFYNATVDQCFPFVYSGCGGNNNRFKAEYQCNSVCKVEQGVASSLAICTLPTNRGPCNVPVTKWHYNVDLGLCQPFTFGGCGGNDNKFDTRKECEAFCSVFDICRLPVDVGSCSNFSVRFYFSVAAGECLPFKYGGCSGNANRFRSLRDCSIVCKQVHKLQVDICQLPSDPGPCRWFSEMFFHNASTGLCQKFAWGGCGGNKNRFATMETCLENCGGGNKVLPSLLSTGNQYSDCLLRSDPGPCKAYRAVWYFESVENACRRFLYGGCGGNANKFETLDDCLKHCTNESLTEMPIQSSTWSELKLEMATFVPEVTVDSSGNCQIPKDPGPCFAYQLRWYFDQLEARCQQFHYGGCQGNNNNYNSSAECEAACREFIIQRNPEKYTDPCTAARDPGPCFADFLRYHWDEELRECRPFIYGGCQGNENNFASQEDCYEMCGNNTQALSRRSYKPGDCYEPLVVGSSCLRNVRWHFDIISGDCLPFYFSGCIARGNNFHSHEDCISFCLKVTELCGIFQCDLKCEYGHRRGIDGCLSCECSDPCENFACGDNLECHLDNSTCTDGNCQPKPVCKPPEKSGECPIFSDNWVEINGCKSDCKRDADCSGTDKCCYTGCGKTCAPLLIKEAPSIEENSLLDIVAVIGDAIKIPCVARGAPQPQIAWFKNGNPIIAKPKPSENDIGSDDDDDGFRVMSDGSLTLTNVTQQDSAQYTCRAFNNIASSMKNYSVTVQTPARIKDVVPHNQTVREGGSVTFSCLVEGDPQPVITWHRDGKPISEAISPSDELHHFRGSLGSVLEIHDAQLEFSGDYACSATNNVGPTQKQSVMLEVLGLYYVNITTNRTNYTVGSSATFWCSVQGKSIQEVALSWGKDGKRIPMELNRFTRSGNELVVEDLEVGDSGEYVCLAKRRDEVVEASIHIEVIDEIPENCTDRPEFANCPLLVRANLCRHRVYGIICCRSCQMANRQARKSLKRP